MKSQMRIFKARSMLLTVCGPQVGPKVDTLIHCKWLLKRTLISIRTLNSDVLCQMAQLGFIFPTAYTAALGFEPTSVSRVSPDWDL